MLRNCQHVVEKCWEMQCHFIRLPQNCLSINFLTNLQNSHKLTAPTKHAKMFSMKWFFLVLFLVTCSITSSDKAENHSPSSVSKALCVLLKMSSCCSNIFVCVMSGNGNRILIGSRSEFFERGVYLRAICRAPRVFRSVG